MTWKWDLVVHCLVSVGILGGCAIIAFWIILIFDWAESDAQAEYRPLLREIPERYQKNMALLLNDYQEQLIDLDTTVQVLLLWHKDNQGVFMPLFETDTYADKYFIHKKTHVELKQAKQSWQQYQQKAVGK